MGDRSLQLLYEKDQEIAYMREKDKQQTEEIRLLKKNITETSEKMAKLEAENTYLRDQIEQLKTNQDRAKKEFNVEISSFDEEMEKKKTLFQSENVDVSPISCEKMSSLAPKEKVPIGFEPLYCETMNTLAQKGKIATGYESFNDTKSTPNKEIGGPGQTIRLELHRGKPHNVTILNNNTVAFADAWSTVAAPEALMLSGARRYYEVTIDMDYTNTLLLGCYIGWATTAFKGGSDGDALVGRCAHSWGVEPLKNRRSTPVKSDKGIRQHDSEVVAWGKGIKRQGVHVISVALDMVKGEILYCWDGNWDSQRGTSGVAFQGIDRDLKMFPAISGNSIKMYVNFGGQPFKYDRPPHPYFRKLADP